MDFGLHNKYNHLLYICMLSQLQVCLCINLEKKIILEHGSSTRGPSGYIVRPAATFLNYVYSAKISR